MAYLRSSEVQQLLHNKFVVILGDSVQRTVYKDLVLLLQKDRLLSYSQLRAKGELSFEQDELVAGGEKDRLHNGIQYREVRQFCSGHHLVRFYFLTRVYSEYLETILEELQAGEHAPDVVVMNSCLWDLSRYGKDSRRSYRENLASLFGRLDQVLPSSCLFVWNTAMPVGEKITGGFLPPKYQHTAALRSEVVEANFYSFAEAREHHFDLLDLHFHFRHAWQHRQADGVHWNERAHRRLSQLLLAHVADAWGVELPRRDCVGKWITEAPVRAPPGRGVESQPQAGRNPVACPPAPLLPQLWRTPLLPPPPPPPLLPRSFLGPHPGPRPQFPPPAPPQDAYFFSDQPLQSDQFSGSFHLDVPAAPQRGFFIQSEFVCDPQPPKAHFPVPHQQRAPVVHRGFPRSIPHGPYVSWRRQPKHSKRRAPTRLGSSPQ
ncbi:PC-esterase domain-containing protein 1B [Dasypus novemcinctus]|uniref:PC-esterase domain-containing protein 1B n=1 Tax=Dasypus novemcinctus TaxID=9361 RepID=UPI000329245A|nr:PC-esterase domain-containing protein 1B [Dasypus novemcinctus]XP_058163858.1 PC-esterase domain-containing protein 1B [Dasypus novemcinctus]